MMTYYNRNLTIKENNSNNLLDDNAIFFPKVICFASLHPFHRELTKILDNLYDYFLGIE